MRTIIMDQTRTSNINMISNALLTFLKVLPALLIFETVYKLLCELIFQPALRHILQGALNITGYRLAFNGDIAGFLTNIPGLIGAVIICILAAVLAYFEFAVLIVMIYKHYQNTPVHITQAMKLALTTFRSLKGLGFIGFAVYSLGLLPFIKFGYAPSILPSVAIPNFITGELYKTFFGSVLIVVVYFILYVLFFAAAFVLPTMVLRRLKFGRSCRASLASILSLKPKQAVPLIVLFLLWCVLLVFPGIIPTYYAGITDASLAEILGSFFISWRGMLHFLLVEGLKICLTILIFTFVTAVYLSSGGKVNMHDNATPNLDRSLKATQGILAKTYNIIKKALTSLGAVISSIPLYQRHRKLIWGIIAVLIFLAAFSTLYSQPVTYDQVVVGHRGSQSAPENTLKAIDGAIEADADYAEVDILLSKDGIPMVIHDDDLKRLTGENVKIYDLTAKQLKKLTVTQNGKTGKISTLDGVIDHCRGKIDLLIELKLHGHESRDLVSTVIKVVEENHFQKNCEIMSLEYSLVEQMKTNHPEYKVGYCVYTNLGNAEFSSLRELNIDFLIIEENMASKSFISKCNSAWLPVYVWTLNTREAMDSCLIQGASGIITDNPEMGRQAVDDYIKSTGK